MPHTPEPWTLSNPDGNHFGIFHRTEQHAPWPEHKGSVICTSVIGDLPADQNRANGELLVRAPRMLEALISMVGPGRRKDFLAGYSVESKNSEGQHGMLLAKQLLSELEKAGVL